MSEAAIKRGGSVGAGQAVVASRAGVSWPAVGMAALLGLVFIGVFHFFFVQQHRFSRDNADWSHAYFIPLISVYMLWRERAALAGLRPTVFWPGLVPLVLSIPTYSLFQIGSASNHMGQGAAMLLGLFGVLLLTLGPRVIQPIFLPLAFLGFGVTVSERIMIAVTFELQGMAAHGGWVLLNLLGVTTDLSGHTLQVQHPQTGAKIPLNIAEACSGMRMVIAFAALGVAVALVELKHWWQRIALFMCGVPVALAMNVVRVAVLGIGSLYNPELARGQAHMFIGFVLLALAFVVFMGISWVLNKTVSDEAAPVSVAAGKGAVSAGKPGGKAPAKGASKPAAKAPVKSGGVAGLAWPWAGVTWNSMRSPGFVTAVAVLGVSAVGLNAVIAALGLQLVKKPIYAEGGRQVSAVQRETASWVAVGNDAQMPEEMIEELGTKNYLSRVYRQKDSAVAAGKRPIAMELHLAYYTGMIDTVPHVPERCLTGAGFLLVDSAETLPVKLSTAGWTLDEEASELATELDRDGRPQRVLTAWTRLRDARVRLPRNIEDLEMRFSSFQSPEGGKQHAAYFFMANGGWTSSAEGIRLLAFKLDDVYAYYLKVQVTSSMVGSSEELAEAARSLLSELLPDIARSKPDWTEVQRGVYPPAGAADAGG
jgi:exosortase